MTSLRTPRTSFTKTPPADPSFIEPAGVAVEQLPHRSRRRQGLQRLPRPLTRLTGVVLVLAGWQAASSTGVLAPDVLGSPGQIARAAGHLAGDGQLGSAVAASLQRVAIGAACGIVVGVVLALIAGLSRIGEDVVDAPVQMARTIPFAGVIPLLIVWLGVGETPKIVLIAVGVTFPIYLNLAGGIRSVDPGLLEVGRTLGLSRVGRIVHVVLPAALPQLLVGLRIALGVSWLALVFAEQINATSGLGYLMSTAQELLQSNTIVVCLIVYGLLGLIVDAIVRLLERVLLAWRPRAVGGVR